MAKKIIICFDGTKNDPSDAQQDVHEHGGIEDDGISNILKLYFLLGGRIENINQSNNEDDDPLLDSVFPNQQCFYFQGVGSYGGPFRKLINAGLSPRLLDVRRIINNGLEVLKSSYESGDEIYLFGFSRGAAIARRFASILRKDETKEKIKKSIDPKAVRFLGVFDTVSSFGIPKVGHEKKPESKVLFENANHVSGDVIEALHILSLDERRLAFRPTLMANEDRINEVWFPGVHSDVGGGYFYDGLSDITLDYLLKEFDRRGLNLQIRDMEQIVSNEFNNNDNEYGLDIHDIKINPDHLSKLHWHKRLKDFLLEDRDLRICASRNHGAVNQTPLIHHSAMDLIADDHDYRTASLDDGMPYKAIDASGTASEKRNMDLAACQTQYKHKTSKLSINDTKTVHIHASQFYAPTHIQVTEGEEYKFACNPDIAWADKTVKCNATGWTTKDKFSFLKGLFFNALEGARRHEEANWFELLGSIGRDDTDCFRVPEYETTPYEVLKSGELFMFPNDLMKTYDNNRGYVEVTITRVK